MTTRQNSQGTTLLAGTRYANNENAGGIVGKSGIAGKPRLTSAGARAALGNISNKAALHTKNEGKKGLQEALVKPSRGLTKSHATSSLKPLAEKQNTFKIKEDKPKEEPKHEIHQQEEPAPMDISAHSLSDAFSKQLLHVQDIDKDDFDNPQLVSVYVNEIYDYMRMLERKFPVKDKYLEGTDLNGRMRGILIDWLVQVHLRFHLLQETLFLTVAIIDRFLQTQTCSRSKLQLVGVTAMLVASKYEEMYAPEIGDFVYITDNAYTKAEIRKMECFLLKNLDFNLGRPLPLHFLRRNSKAGEVDATQHTLAKYLVELCIVEYDMAHIEPSKIAAAALCLSLRILDGTSEWSDTLVHYSKYTQEDLAPIMKKMCVLVQKAGSGKLTAIYTKYKSSKFMKISVIPELQSQVVKDIASGSL